MPKSVIKAEHVNPFIASTEETFVKMVGIEAKHGKLALRKDSRLDYDISGIIGLSGGAKGMISLSFPKAVALAITNLFMQAENKEIDKDTVDALGELANIVAGNAKKGLSDFNINISLPNVIVGANHQVLEPKDVVSFVVPFQTSVGEFHLIVSLKSSDG
jgi:chemotaxis protein CheX